MKEVIRKSKFSECGQYREWLARFWDMSKPHVMCIGLNPSRAGSIDPKTGLERDDSTIRLLIKMLDRLGYGGFYMCNLYTIVSTNPDGIFMKARAFAPDFEVLREISEIIEAQIFCWGKFPRIEYRASHVIKSFPEALCFGKTKDGFPLHPMGLGHAGKATTVQLEPFRK